MKMETRRLLGMAVHGVFGVVAVGSLLACMNSPYRRTDGASTNGRATNGATSKQGDPAPAPKVDPDQYRCEQRNAQACIDLGKRSLASAHRNPDMGVRALQSYFQACDLGRGDACYAYGLLNWQGVGSDYIPEEVSYGLGRANELGYEHARVDYRQLTDPRGRDAKPTPATLYHLKQGCSLGIQRACSVYKMETDGRVVKLPSPSSPNAPGVVRANPPAAPVATEQPGTTPRPPVPAATPKTPTPTAPVPATTPVVKAPVVIKAAPAVAATATAPNPSAANPPRARLSVLEDRGIQVDGPLSLAKVLASIEPRRSQLVFCYERALSRAPGLKGSMALHMTINPDGFISGLTIKDDKLGSAELTRCVSELVGLWQFDSRPSASKLEYRISFGVKY